MTTTTTETENSEPIMAPPSPQEPMAEAPIPTRDSETAQMPPEALEAPREADSATPVIIPSGAEAVADKDNEQISPENGQSQETAQTENPSSNEPVPTAPEPATAQIPPSEPLVSQTKQSLLAMAREAIQFRKKKKLQKILDHFLHKSPLTNDDVEKLLHVSDATATRYLEQLEKGGRIKQNGRTGKSVTYSRIL